MAEEVQNATAEEIDRTEVDEGTMSAEDRVRKQDEESLKEVRNELTRTLDTSIRNFMCAERSDFDATYVEPVQDPHQKAIKYLEKHNILQLFQAMTTNIVYKRPENPVDFMIDEIGEMKKAREQSASGSAKTGANA